MAAWLAAAAPILGGIAGYLGQKETNATNRQIARDQQNFQEDMSNTSHQRAVEDLKKAGLNPLLAATNGASTPTGASAVMGNAVASGLSSAAEVKNLQLSIDRQEKELEAITASTNKTKAETNLLRKKGPEADTYEFLWNTIKDKAQRAFQPSAKMPSTTEKEAAHKRRREIYEMNSRKLNPHKGLK